MTCIPPVILKRTFVAATYPEGSRERAFLNSDPLTSEFSRSDKYVVVSYDRRYSQIVRSKRAGKEHIRLNGGTL